MVVELAVAALSSREQTRDTCSPADAVCFFSGSLAPSWSLTLVLTPFVVELIASWCNAAGAGRASTRDMQPHVRKGLVAASPNKDGRTKRNRRQPATAPSARPAALARWSGSETVELINEDWDRVAGHMDGRTLDAALAEHSLESTRDVKRWENALLQEQLAELEACGVHKWLETTKRGLGLFLCVDSAGRLIVNGVEAPTSASREGVPVGCEVLSINGAPIFPDESGTSAATALLSTVCHRRVKLVLSPPSPPAVGTAGPRAWQPFPEFKALSTVGEPLITIEHCCCCKDHQDTTRHDEGKYVGVADELMAAILELVPYARVELKPFDQHDPIFRGRLGTMEVQLGWRGVDGSLCKRVVWSKRVRGRWPKVWKVAETVLTQLKMTPAVVGFANPELMAATRIQAAPAEAAAELTAAAPEAAPAEAATEPTVAAPETAAAEEEKEEEPKPKPEQQEPQPEPEPEPQPEPEPEPEPEPDPEPEPEPPANAEPAETEAIDSADLAQAEDEPHGDRSRWQAALGRWVLVDPNDEDEDTLAEMEEFSPGGGLCRLCEVLSQLEEGLLMLTLERTAAAAAAEGDEDTGDRTDVFPCDVIQLVDDETASALDKKFGSTAEWAARCAEARTERLGMATALDGGAGSVPVRVRPPSDALYMYCTARKPGLAAKCVGCEATLVSVAESLGGYDDRPFVVDVAGVGTGLQFSEGEVELAG